MLLDDRVALITGASKGIGRAIATRFAAEGASVVICARGEAIDAVATDIRERGGKALALRGDVRDEAFAKEMFKQCRAEHGRLDVLVNNAGIMAQGLLGMIPTQSIRDALDVNVVGLINLTQYAVRLMNAEHGPSIVNLASIGGTRGLEGATAYSATKGAVVAFTRASAKELAPKGIRVNAIAPGYIETEMTGTLSEEWQKKRLDSIAMRRAGTCDEVASVAVFLASGMASYVTGQVLGVDGGMVG